MKNSKRRSQSLKNSKYDKNGTDTLTAKGEAMQIAFKHINNEDQQARQADQTTL
jgi:hypothetical protein